MENCFFKVSKLWLCFNCYLHYGIWIAASPSHCSNWIVSCWNIFFKKNYDTIVHNSNRFNRYLKAYALFNFIRSCLRPCNDTDGNEDTMLYWCNRRSIPIRYVSWLRLKFKVYRSLKQTYDIDHAMEVLNRKVIMWLIVSKGKKNPMLWPSLQTLLLVIYILTWEKCFYAIVIQGEVKSIKNNYAVTQFGSLATMWKGLLVSRNIFFFIIRDNGTL